MKPVVCFFKNDQFIFSENYEIKQCTPRESVVEFLRSIENQFASDLKVVQVNFEFENQALYSDQKELYSSAKASVFILKTYEIKNLSEVILALNPESKKFNLDFSSLVSKENFIKKTNYVIEQIKNGRVYQANLTAPLQAKTSSTAAELFCQFQAKFNGSYKALLPLPHVNLLCFSPELFLHQQDGKLMTRPIKGSLRPDDDFNAHLFKNEKEDAELSMIVDLLRNDLNALSDIHDSVVDSHREKLQLGYIQHTYSEISVNSKAPLSFVLEKTFPGGSISGCPKLESLYVIREVEPYKRQVYTGSLGWWQNNDFCLNVTIRSLIHSGDDLFYHAGCGIVYDSDPEAEWKEFLLKMGALNVK